MGKTHHRRDHARFSPFVVHRRHVLVAGLFAAMAKRQTLSLSDLSALGTEDRIAVMNMVKEGEVTIDEAIAKVKGEAMLKQKRVGHCHPQRLWAGTGVYIAKRGSEQAVGLQCT